jgi:hypothetical protein
MSVKISLTRIKNNPFVRPWLQPSTGVFSLLSICAFILSLSWSLIAYNRMVDAQKRTVTSLSTLHSTETDHGIVHVYNEALRQVSRELLDFQRKKFDQSVSVDAMKGYLKKWQKLLKIQTLTTDSSSISGLSGSLDLKKISYTLEVKVLSDKILYQLIDKLQTEVPGLVVIRHLSLEKKSTGAPSRPANSDKNTALIEGKIEFDWIFVNEK